MKPEVLVVEDDLDVLELYKLLLTMAGFDIWACFTTGEAALDRLRASDRLPDVAVLDHRLPGCTGIDVARELLKIDPAAQIIVASADDGARSQALALGIRRFKRKPVNNACLLRNIRDALADRHRLCPEQAHP